MLRKDLIVTDRVYHIFNRGVNKEKIFSRGEDYKRFFETATHYLRNTTQFSHAKRYKHSDTGSGSKGDVSLPKVQVLAYCLMPNHFHFLIKQLSDGGITWFMQHLSNSYSHYVRTKYKRTGHLFEGRFKNRAIDMDEILVHISRYIHLNPLVSDLVSTLENYKWSSYSCYVTDFEDGLTDTEEILSIFPSKRDYQQFVLDQVDYGKELEKIKHLTID